MRKFSINRTGDAIGDHMMAAFFVQMLNDNGIPAVYGTPHYRSLVDVPLSSPDENYEEFYFFYHDGPIDNPTFNREKTILELVTERFKAQFAISQPISIHTEYVPVKYEDEELIQGYDVAMVTRSGVWTRVRDWPFFDELKQQLDVKKINYIDLTASNVRNNACLNYVSKSKVYLGLETGVSHYVSQVVSRGLILQSGYSDIDFWCPYDYEHIEHRLPCSKCFIHCKTRPYSCPNEHRCMREISVEEVVRNIERLLE